MIADFLPDTALEIQDVTALALLQQIQRDVLSVQLAHYTAAIATAYAHSIPSGLAANTPPILLLAGFDSSLLEFRRLLPLLARCRETWAIDWLGSGFTQYEAQMTVTPQTIRQHLLSSIETWIGQAVVLVGASLGGAVAIDFALHYPDWVQSLVLMDSVGFSGSFGAGAWLPEWLIDIGADWLAFRKRVAVTAVSVLPVPHSGLADDLRCSRLHQEMPHWKQAIAAFTRSGGYADLSDQIYRVTHPTLILWGEGDDILGTADAIRFEQAIPGSQLVWISGAGHVPHFDQPQRVADAVLTFAQQQTETFSQPT